MCNLHTFWKSLYRVFIGSNGWKNYLSKTHCNLTHGEMHNPLCPSTGPAPSITRHVG